MKKHLYLWAVLLGLFLQLPSGTAADSAASRELEGKWSMKQKGDDGSDLTNFLEFKGDRFTFRIQTSGGDTVFFAKGKATFDKAGPLKTMKLTDLEFGGSEFSLETTSDERWFIYTVRYGSLILASNFDKERENEEPKAETYSRVSK